jgi:hypothetical protein
MNIAIAFGRLGLVDPKYMAQTLDSITKQWCLSIRTLKKGEEKESAFT